MAARHAVLSIVSAALFWAQLVCPVTAAAQETVHFDSADSDLTHGAPTRLDGYLFKPEGAGPFPAIVGLNGCGGLFNRDGQIVARETAWAALLNARGYVVLYPDSFGPRHVAGGCIGGTPVAEPSRERARDAYGALLFLQSLAMVVGDRVGVIGWSHGGGTVMFAISKAFAGRPTSLPKGDFRAAVAFYPGWCDVRYLGPDWTTAIPLLWLNGAVDDWTPARPCHDVIDRAVGRGATIDTKIYDGAYHDFDWPGQPLHTIDLLRHPPKVVHVGFDHAAHDDAVARVPAYLDSRLKPGYEDKP
jgi:dienelactone hydrolase